MIEQQLREYLLPCAFNAAVRAGAEIMKVYRNSEGYNIEVKRDNTPLTIADRLAHNKIKEVLGATRIPILSEEGREMLYDERKNWDMFWDYELKNMGITNEQLAKACEPIFFRFLGSTTVVRLLQP
jgi:3'(2'), 5'-bisphosphate nucleotidase